MAAIKGESSQAPARPVIGYAPTVTAAAMPRRRRWWVYGVLGVYLLLVAGLLTAPGWFALAGTDFAGVATIAATSSLLALCGVGLMVTPIHATRRRPMTRRSILIPIFAAGLLFGGLVAGGGLALAELRAPERISGGFGHLIDHTPLDQTLWLVVAAAVSVWLAWSVIFILLAGRRHPTSVALSLHRVLIAGSVLELLVAVPSHIIVRRRDDCCAGIYTGTGIGLGVIVALISFGPTVLLLYHQRCKQITPQVEHK